MTEKEKITLEKFGKFIQDGNVSNKFLVEIIKVAGGFLNIKTIADYARSNNMSYQGTKTCRDVINIFNVKFTIDNN